ncbi:MAG: ABC transporter substrate-binding protein, partial [Spirochaetales bacterium]|nr:ABC transporter substrate-binding protein [Spirochaetales bacterium]
VQQQMMGWENKSLDYVAVSGDYVTMYKDDPALSISDLAGMFFLSFNMSDETLANDNLRKALSLSIDKQAIVDNILNNGSHAADYIIPAQFSLDSQGQTFREHIGNPTYNSYNIEKAKEYWEKAKQELNSDNISIDLLYNEDSTLSSVCAFLGNKWQNAFPGLTINLMQTTYNNRLDLMGQHHYQIGLTRWYADYQDPLTYMDMWISSSQMNYGCYSNEDYDALYKQVVGELALNENARLEALGNMENLILNDAAICPLYQVASCTLQNPDYNWVSTVAGFVLYKYTSFK